MTHFEQALLKGFPDNSDPVMAAWRNYALTTNERGNQIVGTFKHFRSNLQGARILDIGSGYGGLGISAGLEGADVTGVDIDSRLIQLAEQNLLDYPALAERVRFLEHDVTKDAGAFGQFDVICCDNVIEHADSPPRLIEAISRLLKDSGFAYMTVPNAFSLGQVLSDCHYQLFAMSLTDRFDGELYLKQAMPEKQFAVSDYHSWSVYEGLFRKFRLEPRLINAWPKFEPTLDSLSEKTRLIRQRAAELESNPQLDSHLRRKLAERARQHTFELDRDIAYAQILKSSADRQQFQYELVRDYEVELWYVIAHRK